MNRMTSHQVSTDASRTRVEYALMLVLLAAVVVGTATGLGLFSAVPATIAAV